MSGANFCLIGLRLRRGCYGLSKHYNQQYINKQNLTLILAVDGNTNSGGIGAPSEGAMVEVVLFRKGPSMPQSVTRGCRRQAGTWPWGSNA